MRTSVAYLTMLCCYVYYVNDSKKQNNDDVQHIQTYAYSPEGYVKSVSLSGGKNLTTERDNLGRVKSKTVSTTTPITDSYTYKSSSKSGYTTGLVHRHTNALGSYIYSYDDDGNITRIELSDGTLLYTYEYDELGQLTEECSRPEQKCTAYAYDINGNITTKTEYPVDITVKEYIFKNVNPSRTYTYSYNNDLWKDELTSYTRVIHDTSGDRTYTTPANTYDAIGNPKKYFGSDLEWDYGRQLRRFYSGLYDTTYSYNADGMLIKQDVTYNTIPDYPINYSYENFYDGTTLIRRTGPGFDAWFDYDESGSPVGMNVTTTTGPSSNPTVTTAQYYFIKNLQGDIVAMADATGAIKCSYTYNSWGKVLSIAGPSGTPSLTDHTNPANINPFRYRGYYYDAENQLYWLQSRFYDPNTGRFLNADGIIDAGAGLLEGNLFIYAANNPLLFTDYTGTRLVIGSIRDESPEQRCMSFKYLNNKTYEIIDLTEKLDTFMRNSANKFIEYRNTHAPIFSAIYFYRNVKDGGELDIKLQDAWKFESGNRYFYRGNELRYDDPGNINFGYVGAVLFPEIILCYGAGINQIRKYGYMYGDLSTFFDDPRDNKMIKYGYKLYSEGALNK